MRTLRSLFITSFLLLLSLPLAAQSTFILTVSPQNTDTVLANHGLTVVKELYDGPNCVYLVSSASSDAAAVTAQVKGDLNVAGFEADQAANLPELNGATQASLNQSSTSILDSLPGTGVSYFGSTVLSSYVTQDATKIIRLSAARAATNLSGAGTVAIIDTGVDPNHPALASALLPGFDFTRGTVGASEFADLDPTIAAKLQQSSTSILDAQSTLPLNPSTILILNQSSTSILDQSSTSILDQSSTSILDGSYPEFGHGTMVAGIVHLVAPTAKIMPLKAFRADGTSNLSDIVQAIYYAANNGANVISMSFSTAQSSPSLQAAIQYALNKNVTLVASAGNDGIKTLVFPASYGGVEGIGSTTDSDQISAFSNFGSGVVLFAAPGEGVITTFPGGGYAAGWGTSFSAPMVAGAAALVLQARPNARPGDVTNALSKAVQISNLGGYGRIDLFQSLTNLVGGSASGGSNTSGSTSGGSL
ncbi:MAG TPA: S8 family serine peptidase [Candidatus Angelobacter sp.]|nr:S8 family serine peptidase [Candidatus Angelobacter sp.]